MEYPAGSVVDELLMCVLDEVADEVKPEDTDEDLDEELDEEPDVEAADVVLADSCPVDEADVVTASFVEDDDLLSVLFE